MASTLALTGGTGFIGRALARQLADNGWHVRALCRPESWNRTFALTGVNWIQGSLEDEASLHRLLNGADAAIHCAGNIRGMARADFDRTNVRGTQTLVHAATRQAVPRLLLLSSLAAREPSLSHYAASKREGERVLAEKGGEMAWTIFRPPAVYGPEDRALRPLFQWFERGIAPIPAHSQGRFSVIYIDDLLEAVIASLPCPATHYRTFALHDGRTNGYNWEQLTEIAASLCGRPVRRLHIPLTVLHTIAAMSITLSRIRRHPPMLSPGKVRELIHPNWVCDNTALTQATGWEPRIPLEAGLQRTMGWPNPAETH